MEHLTPAETARPRTSVEKIDDAIADLTSSTPADEEAARMMAGLQLVLPFVKDAIPQDPDELDELLLRGARLFTELRSDTAAGLKLVARPPAVSPAAETAE